LAVVVAVSGPHWTQVIRILKFLLDTSHPTVRVSRLVIVELEPGSIPEAVPCTQSLSPAGVSGSDCGPHAVWQTAAMNIDLVRLLFGTSSRSRSGSGPPTGPTATPGPLGGFVSGEPAVQLQPHIIAAVKSISWTTGEPARSPQSTARLACS
jgi:hypothetical protein